MRKPGKPGKLGRLGGLVLGGLLLGAGAQAQPIDPTGARGAYTPDVTASATLGALNAAATIRLEGRSSAGIYISTANLDATVTAEVTYDGTNWVTGSFLKTDATVSSTIVFTGGADTQVRGILLIGGVRRARARVSTYVSGTASAVITSTTSLGNVLLTPAGAGGGSTQYTEGDTDASITGTTFLWEDTADTLRAVSAAKPLPVAVISGGGGGTSSSFGSAFPTTGTAVGLSDGTNMRAARAYDTDTSGGTEYTLGVVLRNSQSGTSAEAGTGTNPIRTDPVGFTPEIVVGNRTNNGGAPGATNLGTLPGVISLAEPVYTAGRNAAVSLMISGHTRVDVTPSISRVGTGSSVSVGVASGLALAANASRKGAVFTNVSANTISCHDTVAAVMNSGITLQPGGVWTMDSFTFTTGAINCIASGAASVMSVMSFQ